MRVSPCRTPGIIELELLGDREVEDAVVRSVLIGRARQRAFGTGAVVADDVDDQRVVELAHVLDRLDHAADFVVGIGRVARVHLGLPGKQLLLVGRKRLPLRQAIRPVGQLGVVGDHSQALLVGEDPVAQDIPAHIEFALELFHPLRLRLVRRVASSGNIVEEERLVGRRGVELLHIADRFVSRVGDEVVIGFADPRENLLVILEKIGRPLIGLAAHEAVEVVEAHPDRPLVERAGDGVLVGRRVVVLAEPRRGIAVVFEDPAERRTILTDDRVVAWKACRQLRDYAKARRMVVASGDQRRPRRRAQRGRVEFGVAQPRLGDAIQRRSGYDATKGAADAISLVVGHDEQNVGRTLGRHNGRWPPRFGFLGILLDHAAEFWLWRRDLIPLDRGRGAGRTRRARDLLGNCSGQITGSEKKA